MNEVLTADVVIVGGGPAGLSAARELRKAGVAEVLVLEREAEAGGIPRHSDHTGYGLRDIKRLMKGPAYARKLAARAHDSGAWVLTSATVTGWADGCSLLVTRPSGRMRVDAKAVILATGARERPRAARLVPGDRPAGVLTTGQLQTAIHAGQGVGGTRAVVVGSQLVSWSAVLTLREAGCATVLMTSEFPAAEVPALVRWGASRLLGGPLARRTRITRIIGRVRVEAVEVEDLRTGIRRLVACDTVVFTGDWIPDSEVARLGGLDIDRSTRGPLIDTAMRTSRPGVFAAGNMVHPADTAAIAALEGRMVARDVARWLAETPPAPADGVRLVAGAPFAWVSPGMVREGDEGPPLGRLLLWATASRRFAMVVAEQDGARIGRRLLLRGIAPGRVIRVPWSLCSKVDPRGGDVTFSVR